MVDHYGACAGGHAVQISSAKPVKYTKVLALLWKHTEMTGWRLTTEVGQRNEAGRYFFIFRRFDGS